MPLGLVRQKQMRCLHHVADERQAFIRRNAVIIGAAEAARRLPLRSTELLGGGGRSMPVSAPPSTDAMAEQITIELLLIDRCIRG